MKLPSKVFATFFLIGLLTLLSSKGWADGSYQYVKALTGSANQLSKDSVSEVADSLIFSNRDTLLVRPYNVTDAIIFKIDEDQRLLLNQSFSANVKIRITLTKYGGSTYTVDTALTLNYNPADRTVYTSYSSLVFHDAFRVNVKILQAVTINPAINVKAALVLQNVIISYPRFVVDCKLKAVKNVAFKANQGAVSDELAVSWTNVLGADEYDLEWAYIDSSALSNYRTGSNLDPDKVFVSNSTRITTSDNTYSIPILYDTAGVLFVRARAVFSQDGHRLETNWSSDNLPNGVYTYGIQGHENSLNWQSSITYAEDGKRKVVIQYFDGSLRSRQTVTKDNTTNTTVVAESFYDYQGRPVVQVLPAPTLSTIIQYTKSVNVGLNGAEYTKDNYDFITSPTYYCNAAAAPMDSASGASYYYSANNTEPTPTRNYIPQARNYAFTETEYTQDNTGRISRQGGVGKTFQLGSGHETKYFYGGAPAQEEIDALFGTEAGKNSHYFKNMVRDANGQYSISYTDMHGRTVATALSGPNPATLDTISSYKKAIIKETLSDSAFGMIKDLAMETNKTLLVSKIDDYVFQYDLNPEILQKNDCGNTPVCYDCLYDLEIKITDDCNNQKNNRNGQPFDTIVHNFSLTGINADCSSPDSSFHLLFTRSLEPGSYQVTKKLTVSRYALDYYRDSVFMVRNTCISLDSLLRLQAKLRVNAECKANALGDVNPGDDGDIKDAMLQDMSAPSGQYANPDKASDIYSIFYSDADNAILPKYQSSNILYKDENGVEDKVFDDRTQSYVTPQQLDPDQFARKFKQSWALALLPYHPEYCTWQKYTTGFAGSLAWDRNFEKADTYQRANSLGYLNPTANSIFPFNRYTTVSSNIDPLSTYSSSYKSSLETSLKTFQGIDPNNPGNKVSMWVIGSLTARIQDGNSSIPAINDNNAFDPTWCAADLDMAWRAFRNFYLQVKKDIVFTAIQGTVAGVTCSQSPTTITLLAAGHTPNFITNKDALQTKGYSQASAGTNVSQIQGEATDSLNAYYANNCKAYATQWMQQLSNCYPANIINDTLIPRLIQVCKDGSDVDHPYGSRTTATATHTFNSFDDVINKYNRDHNINTTGSVYCNADVITAPKPYNQQAVFANKPIYTKPSACECSLLNGYKSEFLTYKTPADNNSFSTYMSRKYHTTISDSDLSTLLSRCNTARDCNYLPSPIYLDPALQCSSGYICANCELMTRFKILFDNKYPGIIPSLPETDTVQRNKNQLFANFMNNQLGFSKQAWEYINFLNQCNALNAPDSSSCYKSRWSINYAYTSDTVNAFYKDMNAGVVHLSKPVSSTQNIEFNYRDSTMCFEDFFSVEFRAKYPLSEPGTANKELHFGLIFDEGKSTQTNISVDFAQPINFSASGAFSTNPPYVYIQDTALTKSLDDWKVIKLVKRHALVYVYYEGQLVKSIPYNATLPQLKLSRISMLSTGPGAYLDWVKLYDSTNTLLFTEDFNSCQNFSKIPDRFSCSVPSELTLCGKQTPVFGPAQLEAVDNCSDSLHFDISVATELYKVYTDSLKNNFDSLYRAKCLNAYKYESFTVTHPISEYHYTLYYYDQAGNLVKTVPPAGIDTNTHRQTWLDSVKLYRNTNRLLAPNHKLTTVYCYNSLNQVISQMTPDAGSSHFYYDRLGRLILSQNAKQKPGRKYSYTQYDAIGRIAEVGELTGDFTMTTSLSKTPSALSSWLNNYWTSRTQITKTYYDIGYVVPLAPYITQRNLRSRVAWTALYSNAAKADATIQFSSATFYTYDVHGNVDTLLQDYGNKAYEPNVMNNNGNQYISNRFKRMVYQYDLISGKVNEVAYQPPVAGQIQPDAFYHRYSYDAENRLTDAETSQDSLYWEKDAHYTYYRHGPLSRILIGDQQVQGVDYAYTLQGWLKGVNTTTLTPQNDIGKDGNVNVVSNARALDVYGFALHYYDSTDYQPIGGVSPFASVDVLGATKYRPLYNGNIAASAMNITSVGVAQLYSYSYDQLNRLTAQQVYKGLNISLNRWVPASTKDYNESVRYDGNGNILTYNRYAGNNGGIMDSLRYGYVPGTNRLDSIGDKVGDAAFSNDIDNQAAHNYTYDSIGNMVSDSKAGILNIEWTVYGKISKITKNNGMIISYWYDAAGNRVGKTVSGKTGNPDSTWYVRDASGNVMSVYTKGNTAVNSGNLTQSETDIYGSSRLGMIQPAVNVQNWAGLTTLTISGYGSSGYFSSFTRGNKRYELSNHLGNVLAVVSDRKTAVGSGSVVNYYKAEVVSAQDYYPFGMQQKERTYYGDTSTVLYAGDGSSYVPSTTPEYVAQYESSIAGNYPYVDSSALRDNNITGGKWTNSQGGWTTYNGQSGRALAISSATPTTTTLTFEYDVASGYKMSVSSFSFYQRASSTGYSQYTLSLNGTQVGSGNLFVDAVGQDNPLQWTGDQTLTTAMNNLTGHVTVVITLSGGSHGSQGTFRMDNFSLNGYTVPTIYSNTAPNLYIHKYNYRYGFNGKENDNEVKGEGDEQDYGMRIYDPRIGRFLSEDPLTRQYPWYSPYAFAGDKPTIAVDLDGLEDYVVINYYSKGGRLESTDIMTLTDKTTKQLIDMQLRTVNKDGSFGELAAQGQKVLVRNIYSENNERLFKKDEPKDALSPRELAVYLKGDVVKEKTYDPFFVQVTQGPDLNSEKRDYTLAQFVIDKKSKHYPLPAPIPFQGKILKTGTTYNFSALGVYIDRETPPEIGIQDAQKMAKALQNTGIKSIIIQPTMVDGTGGATANTVMGNGKTQRQNFDANYNYLGNLIQKLSGVKVTVLPTQIRTTTITSGESLNVKTN